MLAREVDRDLITNAIASTMATAPTLIPMIAPVLRVSLESAEPTVPGTTTSMPDALFCTAQFGHLHDMLTRL